MTTLREEIFSRLSEAFSPLELEIIDDSAKHRGHRESGSGQETHFRIRVVSVFFEGKNTLMRHRVVYTILNDLMRTSIHALSLTVKTPQEQGVTKT